MGRAPCCDKANVKKGPWSPEEDAKLKNYIHNHGTGGNWIALPQKAGLKRCGKSCRLRWLNYLRPNIKHGEFSDDEDRIICSLFSSIGSRWSIIAAHLPGRTDNDIKNYWNTKLKKKLFELSPVLINPHPKGTPQINIYPTPNHNSFLHNYSPNNNNFNNIYGTSSTPPRVFTNPSTVFQAQESMGPTNYNNNLMMFKNEASCSTSSDASGGVDEELGFLSFLGSTSTTGVNDETHQKINICNLSANDYQNKANDELDYSIEEIKQLISSNNDDDDSNRLNYFEDEIIKTEFEQVLYY